MSVLCNDVHGQIEKLEFSIIVWYGLLAESHLR
jgi:hypothetical protein